MTPRLNAVRGARRALGFGAFRVTNIFAWRETDPKKMRVAARPCWAGKRCRTIAESCPWADRIIAAWGDAWGTSGPGSGC